jgi:hypothetical protein
VTSIDEARFLIQIDGGSHSIALSQPQRVSEVIMDAVAAVGAS